MAGGTGPDVSGGLRAMLRRLRSWLGGSQAAGVAPVSDWRPPPLETKFFQYHVPNQAPLEWMLSWVEPETVSRIGLLPSFVIIASATPDGFSDPATRRMNREFRLFLSLAMGVLTPGNDRAQAVARRIGVGVLAVPDSRGQLLWDLLLDPSIPGMFEPPPASIVGHFDVAQGRILAESYRANPGYSADGPGPPGSVPPAYHREMLRLAEAQYFNR